MATSDKITELEEATSLVKEAEKLTEGLMDLTVTCPQCDGSGDDWTSQHQRCTYCDSTGEVTPEHAAAYGQEDGDKDEDNGGA